MQWQYVQDFMVLERIRDGLEIWNYTLIWWVMIIWYYIDIRMSCVYSHAFPGPDTLWFTSGAVPADIIVQLPKEHQIPLHGRFPMLKYSGTTFTLHDLIQHIQCRMQHSILNLLHNMDVFSQNVDFLKPQRQPNLSDTWRLSRRDRLPS